jgi:hypothetical protein
MERRFGFEGLSCWNPSVVFVWRTLLLDHSLDGILWQSLLKILFLQNELDLIDALSVGKGIVNVVADVVESSDIMGISLDERVKGLKSDPDAC